MVSFVLAFIGVVLALFGGNGVSGFELKGRYENDGIFVFYDIKSAITLKCTADENADITWFKNDTKVESALSADRFTVSRGDTKKESIFKIPKALQSDAGEYSCRAKGKQQSFQVAGNVLVKLPSNTPSVEGEKLRLHCNAVGSSVSITWLLPDNSTIDDDGDHDDPR